jgi:hypothetical protein
VDVKLLVAIFLLSSLALPARAEAVAGTAQLCWAMGAFDRTAYYAEATEREDRSQSFAALLDLSGLDHRRVTCVRNAIAVHAALRAQLINQWRRSELDVIDTTFLSDFDD